MNIVDRLEYSNIQEYRIGDTECENLVLKALQCGIGFRYVRKRKQ